MGKHEKALSLYKRSLAITEKSFGNHPNTSIYLHNLGLFYYEQNNFDQALSYLNKAYAIRLKVFGKNHPNTINTQKFINKIKQ